QVLPLRTNTSAAPRRKASGPVAQQPGAPTITVPPDSASAWPNRSPARLRSGAFGVSLACCVNRFPDLTKTYAAPGPAAPTGCGAPITAVAPETPSDQPKLSNGCAPRGTMTCCCDQVVPDRTYAYASPASWFRPTAVTSAVSPWIPTAQPK